MTTFESLKRISKRVIVSQMPSLWREDGLFRVLVRTDENFCDAIWKDALDLEMPAWQSKIQLLCVQNRFSFERAICEADACSVMALSPALMRQNRLKWIHAIPAGLDHSQLPLPPDSLLITSSRGIAAGAMAEHALALLLSLRLKLQLSIRNQLSGKWVQDGLISPARPVQDLSIAVFGLGAVGTEIARMCKRLGMHVIGVTRNLPNAESFVDEACLLEDFPDILPKLDAVILALPLTATTRGLFGEQEFRAMKPTALIVNVARGGLIIEDDLVSALQNDVIAGAGLDVLSEEPPTNMHLFDGCPNLIITPHVSGNIHKFRNQIAARFARNVDAYLAGAPMEGLVSKSYWRDHALQHNEH